MRAQAPLLSQEGRLRRQRKSCEATFERRSRGGFHTVLFKMVVKEPPRRASRVTPPDSGGESYVDSSAEEFIHRFSRPGYTLSRLRR
jgi:hypothetical protein